METIYLIDGSTYIHRAYHAIRGLANSQGLPTNAVFGFTKMLIKLMSERNPGYLAMLFDARGKTFRHELYPEYKANRPAMPEDLAVQIPYIKAVTDGFNIPWMEKSGLEADDLIGTLATKAGDQGFEVVMVTGDKDFLQLIGPRIWLWDPMKDEKKELETVQENYGVAPEKLVDIMALSGDSSDNVPGVPGIGPKTAKTLIQTYGDLENLYANLDDLKKKKKQHQNLIEYQKQAFLSRELVRIRTDADIDFDPENFRVRSPDNQKLGSLFKELEFRQLQWQIPESVNSGKKDYHTVLSPQALDRLAEQLQNAKTVALDTETSSQNPMRARLVGISVCTAPHQAFYIPCGHEYPGVPQQLSVAAIKERLGPIFADPRIQTIGQNIKYDLMVLARHGMATDGIAFDTMIGSYLLDPGKRGHNLDQIALDHLGYKPITFAQVTENNPKGVGFEGVLLEPATDYAAEDADITFRAYGALKPELEKLGLTRLMEQLELPLIPVLAGMEMRGIRVDPKRLEELSRSFESQLASIETNIHYMAGEPFNIRSPQQLGVILFDKLGLPMVKKTKKKTSYSTDVEVLTTLAIHHELPAMILRHRALSKLKSTYADALLKLIHPETGRIHSSFNQTVTATGRLSSSDPNLQNIPVRDAEGRAIRGAFIPEKGWKLISADYSQIELRLLAHCSGDPILLSAFENNEDIHTRTASEVFGLVPEMITPEIRRQAKTINFGIIYGMSPYGLSKELGISRKMAQTYIDNYFSRYQGVRTFIDQTVARSRKRRQTQTLLGRIRRLPEINSPNRNQRAFAERTAFNTLIQGTAADLIKLAMIRTDQALKARGMKTAMLLTVHDELLFEAPPQELDDARAVIREQMEGVGRAIADEFGVDPIQVSLKINLDMGENWAEAH